MSKKKSFGKKYRMSQAAHARLAKRHAEFYSRLWTGWRVMLIRLFCAVYGGTEW